jgi:hypothetical protein
MVGSFGDAQNPYQVMFSIFTPQILADRPGAPEFLYHYTRPDAAISIIESGQLWLSHLSFMNDSSEIAYGRQLTKEVVVSYHPRAEYQERFLHMIDMMAEPGENDSIQNYVICFCGNGDLLSQWRAYGNFGGGYALGFRYAAMKSGMVGSSRGEFKTTPTFLSIRYGPDWSKNIQRECIDRLFQMMDERIEAGASADFEVTPAFTVASEIVYLTWLASKDAGFSEENEVRLVLSLGLGWEKNLARFRAKDQHIVPYVPITLSDASSESARLPLQSVTVGPVVNEAATARSLKVLLEANGYDQVEVQKSSIPFR